MLEPLRSLLERIADFVAGDAIMSAAHFESLFGREPVLDQEEDAFDVVFHTFTSDYDLHGIREAYADDRGGVFISLDIASDAPIAMKDLVELFGPYAENGGSEFEGVFRRREGANLVNNIILIDTPEG